ncbi:hypothetical protein [Paenibacillus sp. 1P07SE]|uniref:hypothetical protein n=1 Tax=Paenibacillus sp. 1P07SE TaxID=3132209 RepID=UPI0039A4A284
MTIKKSPVALLLGAIILSLLFILLVMHFKDNTSQQNTISLVLLNDNLEVEDIQFSMLEEEVIQRWGEGEYIHGFGGHGREYLEKGIRVSFPGDPDNDLFGTVGSLEFSNAAYSIFTIRVGDSTESGYEKLKSHGFVITDYSEDTYSSGEFTIALRGDGQIENIQIWFEDKDLKDRNY